MYQGSSAIQSIERSNMQSVRISATLDTNYYFAGSTARFPADIMSNVVEFNNGYVFYGNRTFRSFGSCLGLFYLNSGFSITSFTQIPGLTFSGAVYSHLKAIGNTLHLTFRGESQVGTRNYIAQMSSGDGQTWSGTSVLFGSSENLSDIYRAGTSNILIIDSLASIKSFTTVGSTWGSTLLYAPASGFVKILGGDEFTSISRVIVQDFSTQGTPIRSIDTDTVNAFNTDNIQLTNSDIQLYSITNASKGKSMYYFGIQNLARNYQVLNGTTVYIGAKRIGNGFIYMSNNLRNFSSGIVVPVETTGSSQPFSSFNPLITAVLGGLSGREQDIVVFYSKLANTGNTLEHVVDVSILNKGGSIMDISDHIINYNNKDNSRISLTLGNYA